MPKCGLQHTRVGGDGIRIGVSEHGGTGSYSRECSVIAPSQGLLQQLQNPWRPAS
jgi:hypothetical protein